MRFQEDYESPDVIDRRGQRGGPSIGGLLPLIPFLLRSPLGWLVLLGVGAFWLLSSLGRGTSDTSGARAPAAQAEQREVHFVSFVLDDAQNTWARKFSERGLPYRRAKLVLFTDTTQTGCGFGQAASGPFYCPADERVYIDLGFFRELSSRFKAKGDFAQAYVIAHEIGHHVQKLLGISERARNLRGSAQGASGASVRLELQADCFAGIWARSTGQRNLLERGDLDEALTAAQAIGDDRLQRQSSGTVHPESFTHGTSAQRQQWLKEGYDSGKIESCDTFSASGL